MFTRERPGGEAHTPLHVFEITPAASVHTEYGILSSALGAMHHVYVVPHAGWGDDFDVEPTQFAAAVRSAVYPTRGDGGGGDGEDVFETARGFSANDGDVWDEVRARRGA